MLLNLRNHFKSYRVAWLSGALALGGAVVADASTSKSSFSSLAPFSAPGLISGGAGSLNSNAPNRPTTRSHKPFPTAGAANGFASSAGMSTLGSKLAALLHNGGTGRPLISAEQQTQFAELLAQQGDRLKIHFDQNNGSITYLEGRFDAPSGLKFKGGVSRGESVQAFLGSRKALFKLKDPATELKLLHETTDERQRTHLFYQQTYKGIPLWGKQLIAHVEADNTLYLVNGRAAPTPNLFNTKAKISIAEALAVVKTALKAPNAEVLESELVIYTDDASTQFLVYRVDVRPTPFDRWMYFVNANNGAVVHTIHNIHAAGAGVAGSGTDSHGNSQAFNVWSENNTFYMFDPSFPSAGASSNPVQGPNTIGDTYILDAKSSDGSQLTHVTSNNANGPWDTAAVDAMHNTWIVYNYYNSTFKRNSIDGNGKNLLVMIHAGDRMANAFWNGTFMIYGDGDNKLFSLLTKCLDVAGHEMTHGVIQSTAGLIYENQSGALNESFADVFGALVEGKNWLMGEDCTVAAPRHLRNLQDPHSAFSNQPAKMSEYENLPNTEKGDNGGVHVNSGIPNHAAYLTWQNLGGDEAARRKLEQIYYKALTTYLAPSSLFIDARRALIKSAEDIYKPSTIEAKAVTDAWDAVEVTETSVATPSSTAPTSTSAVSGADYMLFLSATSVDAAGNPLYDLMLQSIASDFNYNNSKYAQVNVDAMDNALDYVAHTRPAIYTSNAGSVIFYVGRDRNLYANDSSGAQKITNSGDVWSLALSPDGRYFAYTTNDANDKTIHVLDLNSNPVKSQSWTLAPPTYQNGNANTGSTIYYADSMSFDYTGRTLVFDALNCVPTPSSACNAAQTGGYQFWSIGLLDVTNGDQLYPFPDQDPAIDIGYPTFASNNSFTVAFDVINFTNAQSPGSKVVLVDMQKQTEAVLIDFTDVFQVGEFAGAASFWGDDTAVAVQFPSQNAQGVPVIQTARIPLKADGSGDVDNGRTLNPYNAELPVMHREGVRASGGGGLQVSAALLDFGNVAVGASKDVTLSLSNNSDRDVNITNITISGAGFSHNATNTLLPRGSHLDIRMTYTPVDARPIIGTLKFDTDGTPPSVSVSLAANGGGQAAQTNNSSKKGLFGCSIVTPDGNDPLFPTLLALAVGVLGWRRWRRTAAH